MSNESVLLATLPPYQGGVHQMVRFIVTLLHSRGYRPELAYYQPYSYSPELSVPSYRLLQRSVGVSSGLRHGLPHYAIGSWLPELEFTHYWPTRQWRELIKRCRYHIVVSGNSLAGLAYALSNTPFLGWIATAWDGDRTDRVRTFPWYRRMLDKGLIRPCTKPLERLVLNKGHILALSDYTRRDLNRIIGTTRVKDILSMPIDTGHFLPDSARVEPGKIGFVGRYDDPRKNIGLLFEALAWCRSQNHNLSAELIGGRPTPAQLRQVEQLGLRDQIRFVDYLSPVELVQHLQTLDVAVVPSHQEGLCIAALEAMASGCPVVSTRCGGPEEFVVDSVTGYLVDSNPAAMGQRILAIITDRQLRSKLSEGARQQVLEHYSRQRQEAIFWQAFQQTFHSAGG